LGDFPYNYTRTVLYPTFSFLDFLYNTQLYSWLNLAENAEFYAPKRSDKKKFRNTEKFFDFSINISGCYENMYCIQERGKFWLVDLRAISAKSRRDNSHLKGFLPSRRTFTDREKVLGNFLAIRASSVGIRNRVVAFFPLLPPTAAPPAPWRPLL
jgi:hypothetical protein